MQQSVLRYVLEELEQHQPEILGLMHSLIQSQMKHQTRVHYPVHYPVRCLVY